jgi:RNA polymerase sigma-70 factor (ECF subfamily)
VVKLNPSDRSFRGRESRDLTAGLARCLDSFEHEFEFIYRTLRRNGVNPSDVEDLVHEVFLVMWRRWDEYDQERPLRPWLAGIAFRLAYNHRARAGREVPGGTVDIETTEPSQAERFESARDRALVQRVLASLAENHRAVMLLHDVEGLPMRSIAHELGIPLQTAYSRLRVARKTFAKAVRRDRTTASAREDLSTLLRIGFDDDLEPSTPLPPKSKQRVLSRLRAALPIAGLGGGGGLHPGAGGSGSGSPLAKTTRGEALGLRAPRGFGAGAAACAACAVILIACLWIRRPHPSTARAETGRDDRPAAFGPVPSHPRERAADRHAMLASTIPMARIAPPSPSDAAATLGRGLLGYWRFDDGYGSTVARDLSGNGNDCVLHGLDPASDWTEGTLGGAINLSGVGWLECPRVDGLARLNKEITIALWVKRLGTSKEHPVTALVTRQFGTGGFDHFHLGFRGDHLWLRSLVRGNSAEGAAVPLNRWVHVAGTLGPDGVARVFLDGEEIGRKEKAGRPSIGGGSTPLIIGGAANYPDPHRVGENLMAVVDELVIYDRALGADEIRGLAAGTQPRISP